MNTQNQQDENQVLGVLLSYGKGSDEPIEVICTTQDFCRFTTLTEDRAKNAVYRLEKVGHLTYYKGSYTVPVEGQRRYLEAVTNPKIPTSSSAWKTEARTGITPKGKPTAIQNAAIPGPESRELPKTPEEIVSHIETNNEIIERVADELRVTLDEFDRLFKAGRIRFCKGHDGNDHIGIFNKKGKGFQYLCRECLRKKRKGPR